MSIPFASLGFRDKQGKTGSSSLPGSLVPAEEPHGGVLEGTKAHRYPGLLYFLLPSGLGEAM